MKSYIRNITAAAIAFAALGSCGPEKTEDNSVGLLALLSGSTDRATYTINFAVQGDGQANFDCGSTILVNGVTLIPNDMRFYISDIKLVKSDLSTVTLDLVQDNKWQYQNAVLLDFEAPADSNHDGYVDRCLGGSAGTNTSVVAYAPPAGDYIGVAFNLGLPATLNQQLNTTSPAPLNTSGLYWSWTSGFKFTKIELKNGAVTTQLHIGSTGCTTAFPAAAPVTSCSKLFLGNMQVTKGAGSFNPVTEKVVLDLVTMFGTYNSADSTNGGSCMPGETKTECQKLLTNLGYTFATGASTAGANSFVIR